MARRPAFAKAFMGRWRIVEMDLCGAVTKPATVTLAFC